MADACDLLWIVICEGGLCKPSLPRPEIKYQLREPSAEAQILPWTSCQRYPKGCHPLAFIMHCIVIGNKGSRPTNRVRCLNMPWEEICHVEDIVEGGKGRMNTEKPSRHLGLSASCWVNFKTEWRVHARRAMQETNPLADVPWWAEDDDVTLGTSMTSGTKRWHTIPTTRWFKRPSPDTIHRDVGLRSAG